MSPLPPPGTTPCAPSLRRNTGPCGRRSWQTAPTSPIRRRRWPIRPDAAPCPRRPVWWGETEDLGSVCACAEGTGRVWWCIRNCWARSRGPFCSHLPRMVLGKRRVGPLPSVSAASGGWQFGMPGGSPIERPGTGPGTAYLDWHLTKILHFLRAAAAILRRPAFFGEIDRFFKWDVLFFSYHSFFVVVTSTKNVLALCWNCVMLYMKRAKRSPPLK